jgi:hypothetical protein
MPEPAAELRAAAQRLRTLAEADARFQRTDDRLGRLEIAVELLARGRDPHHNLAWMYPNQAAAIAREIGERHA